MTITLKRGTFKVRCYDPWQSEGVWYERKGFVAEGVLGLHRSGLGWTITHLRSGRGVGWLRTFAQARRVAAELLALGGWQHSERWVRRHRDQVREIIIAAGRRPR